MFTYQNQINSHDRILITIFMFSLLFVMTGFTILPTVDPLVPDPDDPSWNYISINSQWVGDYYIEESNAICQDFDCLQLKIIRNDKEIMNYRWLDYKCLIDTTIDGLTGKDINNDGVPEIVLYPECSASVSNNIYGLLILSAGDELKKILDIQMMGPFPEFLDLDNDGALEIIVSDSNIYIPSTCYTGSDMRYVRPPTVLKFDSQDGYVAANSCFPEVYVDEINQTYQDIQSNRLIECPIIKYALLQIYSGKYEQAQLEFEQFDIGDKEQVWNEIDNTLEQSELFNKTCSFSMPDKITPEPDGWIAYIGVDGNVWLIRPDGKNAHKITDDANIGTVIYSNVKWIPKHDQLTYAKREPTNEGTSIWQFDIVTNQSSKIIESTGGGYDWSPDGSKLVFDSPRRDTGLEGKEYIQYDGLYIYDTSNKQVEKLLEPINKSPLVDPIWSPDGKYIAFKNLFIGAAYRHHIGWINITTKNVVFIDDGCSGYYIWSPDSSQILYHDVFYSNIDRGIQESFIYDIDGRVIQKYSPSSSLLIDGPDWGKLPLIYYKQITDWPPKWNWSPDRNSLLVDGDGEIYIVNKNTGNISFLCNGISPVWGLPGELNSKINDFSSSPGDTKDSFRLTWTSPGGGDGLYYDIRINDQPINKDSWDKATPLPDIPAPAAADEQQEMLVQGLELNKRWYFAMKTVDNEGNESALSNVPSLIDTGFRPGVDGYSFSNGPDHNEPEQTGWKRYPEPPSDEDFTYQDMYEVFGRSQVCLTEFGGACMLHPTIESWFNTVNKFTRDGHCVGMAVSSLNAYLNPEFIQEVKPVANTVYDDLMLSDARREITKFHVLQSTYPMIPYVNEQINLHQPAETLKDIQSMMTDFSVEPSVLFFKFCNGRSGHAVVPFALEEVSDDIWKVWIYENGLPEKMSYLLFDLSKNTWEYPGTEAACEKGIGGDEYHNSIFLTPLSLFTGEVSIKNPKGKSWIDILFFGNGSLLVADRSGSYTGYSDGQEVNEIPGAAVVPVIGGLNTTAHPHLYLPSGQEYQVNLTGDAAPGAEMSTVTQTGSDNAISIENLNMTAATQDQMNVSVDGRRLIYQPLVHSQDINTILAYDDLHERGYVFTIEHLSVEPGVQVTIQITDSGELTIDMKESGDASYDLSMDVIDDKGKTRYSHQDIALDAGTIQAYDFRNWTDGSSLTQYIDQDNDGIWDETYELENTTRSWWQNRGIIFCSIGIILFSVGVTGLIVLRVKNRREDM